MDYLPASLRPGRPRASNVEDGLSDISQPPPPPLTTRRRTIVLEAQDKLSIFRHLVGIHSTRSFATNISGTADLTHNNLHFDERAAPNLGIYNRVCHREQEAKRGYKFAAVLINGCLGVQIAVAASLTALGAANSTHGVITAFGAVNTVIAGLLTYLKGSGLPMRLRYYENEWKKVREYIEQREREFCRPDCPLDVYECVRIIEAMYEDVKADIQTNTPDSWVSVGDLRNRASATNPQVPRLQDLTPHAKKFQDLESKYGPRIAEFLEMLAHKEEERLTRLGVLGVGSVDDDNHQIQRAEGLFGKDYAMGSGSPSSSLPGPSSQAKGLPGKADSKPENQPRTWSPSSQVRGIFGEGGAQSARERPPSQLGGVIGKVGLPSEAIAEEKGRDREEEYQQAESHKEHEELPPGTRRTTPL